ncbi:ribulose-phosphate 3-epimerase [Frigoribacterium faeni]|uniref:Ribulose-phosphate 3-epimerase n=1 Tax=Frigoribacterium faeni TaxID=145483 RepID=A0A7W3JH77_9MICO|nr:ribulose-phosphate 3-epimerase [Frigoribacterium faeni]MBA8812857.1 ribulose-phosphate 3-epimerase [Frigoribacterium faeni]BFF13992.1 ribulose-phosphate 3-epimerase [Microbacterium flavescens]GEK82485.1 ribulose-phosphate 3-epimerase [Frigoribacterium faeni]
MPVRISPSILSADFANLERDLHRIGDADLVHVDVMDGHFVPNLTLGLPVVERIQQVSPLPLDVHLMIDDADRWAPRYAELGAFSVTFSGEAAADPVATARAVRSTGARASVAVKPGTDLEPYLRTLDEFDMILVMTVEPGFGGQSFMADTMPKLARAREAVDRSGLDVWLEVDGGIDVQTIVTAVANGADTVVAGSAVYGGEPSERIAALRAAAATVALSS